MTLDSDAVEGVISSRGVYPGGMAQLAPLKKLGGRFLAELGPTWGGILFYLLQAIRTSERRLQRRGLEDYISAI